MKRIMIIICVIVFLLGSETTVLGGEEPKESELYARSAVLMDADSGRILYEKDGYTAMANASTTKILTCIVALENGDLTGTVTVSANAAGQPKVHLGMRQGQNFYLKDLLYGLMLESYNDCAVAIAEFIAGSTEDFAKLMNEKVAEIGCEDSYFITPNGLDAKDEAGFHHTTASDLAKIMRYCIMTSEKAQEFLEITRTASYGFSDVEQTASYQCYNHNAFLQMMEGALSGKTGFTGSAGYCYVGALTRDGRTYIVALLACGWPNNKTYKWADTKKLMNYGLENFTLTQVSEQSLNEEELAPVPVEGGQGEQLDETVYTNLTVLPYEGCEQILLKEGQAVTVTYEIAEKLQAPVKKGDPIGMISYELDGSVLGTCEVVAAETVLKIDFSWCVGRVVGFFLQ